MELAASHHVDQCWLSSLHDDVIKWKHFPRHWPFVRGLNWSPVNSPHKGQWRRALMFTLICVWINGWVNNREAGDLRRYRAHYDVTVMNTYLRHLASMSQSKLTHGTHYWCLIVACYQYNAIIRHRKHVLAMFTDCYYPSSTQYASYRLASHQIFAQWLFNIAHE